MNQAVRNILLEYLIPGESTQPRRGGRNNQHTQNIFHQRQIESRQMEAVTDMIYYYNRNFATYQTNMNQLTGLLEEMQRARNPFYYLQNADISFNNIFCH
jgi:hypothetical protein